jgi:hypothetical protein
METIMDTVDSLIYNTIGVADVPSRN